MLVVGFFLYDNARECLFADLHFHGVAELEACVNQCHSAALVYRNQVVASGDFAHRIAVLKHCVAVARHCVALQLNAAEALLHAVLLLVDECIATDKFLLVELAEHAEASHDWRDLVAQFVAIERQTHLEAKGVAATQSAWFAAAACHKFIPHLADDSVRSIYFKTVFTGIASA